jgi:hypothetical protein
MNGHEIPKAVSSKTPFLIRSISLAESNCRNAPSFYPNYGAVLDCVEEFRFHVSSSEETSSGTVSD